MSTNKDIKFPYYSGNIKISNCLGHVSLDYFIRAHENPTLNMRVLLDTIQVAVSKEVKRELKQRLFSFTPSVFIPRGSKRKYDNINNWTGLMQLDFDKLDGEQDAEDLKHHIFRNYEQIVCAYMSPSRKGVKALMKIEVPKDKDHYKAIHKAVATEMEPYDCFDNATNNAMLPLFLSYDKNILYREYDSCETWRDADYEEVDYVQLNNAPTNFIPETAGRSDSDHTKTIRIFKNKIKSINSDGHTQLRSACLILGSRVAAGYLQEYEARSLADGLVMISGYLKKDINNYKSTAQWAITEGMKSPKYYK